MNQKTDMQAELKRIASELRAYNPAADEYKGEHIHKVWAREIEAALASRPDAQADERELLNAWYEASAARKILVSDEVYRIVTETAALLFRAAAPKYDERGAFQSRVQPWMLACFGAAIAADAVERNHRFFEEAAELVQACGMTASEAHQLVEYTWSRPIGEKTQEVGGVMVTLAALCLANGLDMHAAGETELARISAPETMAKIRAKQAAKPKHSPLPEVRASAPQTEAAQGVPEGWTGNHEADSALIMLDRLDVSSDDDVRVDAISAIVRKLAAAPSAHAAVAWELIYQVRAETWRHRWNDVPKFIFDQKAALEGWKVRIVCTIPQALAAAPAPVSEPEQPPAENAAVRNKIAAALHYPDHWDTAAYPTLDDAAWEAIAAAKLTCSECGEWQSFPERDATKTNAEQGLYRKFEVRRVDGSDATGGKHDGCEYFVLDMTHDAHAPAALRAYAQACASTHPHLSADLMVRFGGERQGAALSEASVRQIAHRFGVLYDDRVTFYGDTLTDFIRAILAASAPTLGEQPQAAEPKGLKEIAASFVDWELVERMRSAEEIDSEEAGMLGAMIDSQAREIEALRAILSKGA